MQFDRTRARGPLAPRALTLAVAAALATLLAGCAVGPDYKRPAAEIPASYKEAARAGKSRSRPISKTAATGGPSTKTRNSTRSKTS